MLTAAVIGAGTGGSLSLSALQASPRFDLKAVADISPDALQRAASRFPEARVYADTELMLREMEPEVVCVSTPPALHEAGVEAALQGDLKGILVEKPLSHAHASGKTILQSIKSRGLPIAVPHGLLVRPTPRRVMRHVSDGDIGELVLIEIQCHGWDIINAGIHWLDYCLHAAGRPRASHVMAICDAGTRTFRDGMQVETEAVTYAQMTDGLRIVMQTGDCVRLAEEGQGTLIRLIGRGGQLEFWPWSEGYRLQNSAHPMGAHLEARAVEERSPHQIHLENLAEQAQTGMPDYEIAEISLEALEICDAAYLSSRHRCKVHLPLADFTPQRAPDWAPGLPYAGSGGGRDGRQLP